MNSPRGVPKRAHPKAARIDGMPQTTFSVPEVSNPVDVGPPGRVMRCHHYLRGWVLCVVDRAIPRCVSPVVGDTARRGTGGRALALMMRGSRGLDHPAAAPRESQAVDRRTESLRPRSWFPCKATVASAVLELSLCGLHAAWAVAVSEPRVEVAKTALIVGSALIASSAEPGVELVLDRALDDQSGAELRQLRQRLARVLADSDGEQLVDLGFYLHRRR